MLLHPFPFHKYERLFKLGSLILFSLILLVPLLMLPTFHPKEESVEFTALPKESLREQALIAASNYVFVPLPKIEEKLLYVEHNQRPDSLMKNILLGFKNSSEKKLVSLGERIYFRSRNLEDMEFSQDPTPYWIEPKLVKDGALEIEFTSHFEGSDRSVLYENCNHFVVHKQPKEKQEEEVFNQLAFMKVYPPDRLIDLYGGKTFEEEKGRFRLEVGEKQKLVYFIKEGDLLVLSEGKWKEEKETRGLPLLKIQSINHQKCDYSLWSGDGFSVKMGSFSVEHPAPLVVKPAELFSKVYPRSGNSVTCQVRQKNMILREGDWLVKSKTGWRALHTLGEIKKILTFALPGELFVFDGVQKRDGNTYFVGHLFDDKRVHAQRVELLLTEKKIRKISQKKVSLIE